MRFNSINIFFIVAVLLLAITWQDQIAWVTLQSITNYTSVAPYTEMALFALIFLYRIYSIKKIIYQRINPIPIFKAIVAGMLVLSFLWSFVAPIPAMSLYVTMVLPIFAFSFIYSVAVRIENTHFFMLLLLMVLGIMLLAYYQNYQIMLLLLNVDSWTTNSSYFLLYFLPIFLCSERKWVKITTFVAVLIVVAMSAKRGGLFALLLGSFIYLIISQTMRAKNGNKFKLLFFVIVIITLVYYAINYVMQSDLLVISRLGDMKSSGGNGRLEIWEDTLKRIANSNIINLLLGHGYNTVLLHSRWQLSAHNDFLEILYDYGFIMFLMYVAFNIQMVKRIVKMTKECSKFAAPLAFSYVIFFVNSNVSHIFFYEYFLLVFAVTWGGIFGLYVREKNEKQSCIVKQ